MYSLLLYLSSTLPLLMLRGWRWVVITNRGVIISQLFLFFINHYFLKFHVSPTRQSMEVFSFCLGALDQSLLNHAFLFLFNSVSYLFQLHVINLIMNIYLIMFSLTMNE